MKSPLLLLVWTLFTGLSGFAQVVSILPVISPPFSPFFEDYLRFQNQEVMTLINHSPVRQELKLTARLEGDNGLYAYVREGFQPRSAIVLEPLETRSFSPLSPELDFLNLEDIEHNVPIRLQQGVLTSGILPEGNYTFCVQALDFETGMPLSAPSPAGCVYLPISYLQPPVLLNPSCESKVFSQLPTFLWSPPIGNPGRSGFQYDLYLLRLFPDQDPNVQMNAAVEYRAGNPFVAEALPSNHYVYRMADPPLENGGTYAMQVVATDPGGVLQFENNGRSEVCTFVYESPDSDPQGDGLNQNQLLLSGGRGLLTEVSGQLRYHFPGKKKKTQDEQGENGLILAEQIELVKNEAKPGSAGLYQISSYAQPQFFDEALKQTNGSAPLAHVKVKLVIRYILNGYELGGAGNFGISQNGYILPADGHPNHPSDNGKTLAVTYTDAKGNYQFLYPQVDSMKMVYDFSSSNQGWGTGSGQLSTLNNWENAVPNAHQGSYFSQFQFSQLIRVLRLEVESPYYCSPEVNLLVQPGQQAAVPTQVSEVRSYHLQVVGLGDNGNARSAAKKQALEGLTVEILRSVNAPAEIPHEEGQGLGESLKGWEVISRGETNQEGKVLMTHLVRHDQHNPYDRYRIRAATPQINSLDYYEADWKPWPEKGRREIDGPYCQPGIVYNSHYQQELFQTEITLQAGKPQIRGQVIQVASQGEIPLDNVRVTLILAPIGGGPDLFNDTLIFTDSKGEYAWVDLPVGYAGELIFYRFGYHQETVPVGQLKPGDLILPHDGLLKLVPMGKVYGYVSDETGAAIPADVKLGDGPFSPTQYVSLANGWQPPAKKDRFQAPPGVLMNENANEIEPVGLPKYRFMFGAQSGMSLPLRIEPFSDKYFPLDTLVDVDIKLDKDSKNKADYQFLGEFILKEKLHRVRFVLRDEGGKLINGARIEIQDTILPVQKGIRHYAFASPAQFFLVKVIPSPESNLLVWYQEIEIPISPDYTTLEIVLQKGKSISGFVTAGPDSLPLSGARVFVKGNQFWENDDFPLAETLTDEKGAFTLHGLPADTIYTAAGIPVPIALEVFAVKADPQISYVGDQVFVTLPQRGSVRLHLTVLSTLNLTRIWGFPVEVESFTPNAIGGGTLDGAFVGLPANKNFSIKDPQVRLSFQQVVVQAGTQLDEKGIPYARPLEEEILTDLTSLNVDIFEQYTGTLYSRDYYSFSKEAERIVVSHDGAENGLIYGNVGMLLSSFNFSYQYEGKLVLADNPNQTIIPVFSALDIPRRTYNLVNYERGSILKDPSFKVHNFKAHADRTQSYIDGDSVHLFTVLHTNIPDSKPADLKIEAGEIVILPDDILTFSGGKKLTFHLEDWEVAAQSPWYYSKNLGAIIIAEALVHTGTFDVPVKQVRLQPDDLDLDKPDLQQSGLSLGGVVPLHVYTSNFIFGYDTECASDGKAHWKLRLINEGSEPVGMFTGLPGAENQEIYLDHLTLYSNGEQIVGGLDDTVRFYEVMDLHLNQIATGPGFFKLRGRVDLDIPHLSKDLTTQFTFTQGPGGSINSQWEPISFQLETKGKVSFTAAPLGQLLFPNLYHTKGTIRIYSPEGEINLQGQLSRNSTGCSITVLKVNGTEQVIELGDPDHLMVVLNGGTEANLTSNDWEKFHFDARLEGFKGLEDGDNEIGFIVEGDITATDQDISITDISTPLGGIQLIYNFQEQSLFGSMHVNELALGPVGVKSGDFQILMDKRGYYFLFGGLVEVPIVQEIGMALLIGEYPEFNAVMRTTFENYSYNHNVPKGFEDGFSGFLLNGRWEYDLLDNDGIDLGVFAVSTTAKVGLDLRVSADFSSGAYELYVLGYANLGVEVSAFCITGFLVVSAELGLGAQIVNGKFDLVGCASISLGVGYEACVPLDPLAIFCLDACTADCWMGSVKADMIWGKSSSTPSFSVSFGETCSNNSDAMSIGNQSNSPCN